MNRSRLALLAFGLPVLLFGIWHLWQYYDTLAEDAWIHFRYARNLGEGHGLVSHPGGDHEEGYSSLSSILVLGLGHYLGIPLPFFQRMLGILGSMGLILLLHKWISQLHGDLALRGWLLGILGLAVLASSDLAVWSTAGLPTTEYGWLLLLLAYGFWQAHQRPTRRRGLLLGALGFLCLNTRPEGLMYAPIGFAISFLAHRVDAHRTHSWWRCFGPGVLLFLALTALLALWKLAYFGDLLSNPAYVKLAVKPWLDPLQYFRSHFAEHGLLLLILYITGLLFACCETFRAARSRTTDPEAMALLLLSAFLGAQLMFIYYVRGDYMAGFRFFVPIHAFLVGILVLLGLWIAKRIQLLANSPHRQGMFLLLFPVLPLFLTTFELPGEKPMPISSGTIDSSGIGHYQAGRNSLDAILRQSGGPYALSEFGYIPYHLPFEGIDMMGLNQHNVARCYRIYPLEEAVLAARDYVLSRAPKVIATYGYWQDQGGELHCNPATAWFFLPYFSSPYFLHNYITEIPDADSEVLRFSHLRPEVSTIREITLQSESAHDRLLHGFSIEPDKIWAGPIARILLNPDRRDRRIVLEGYQPDLRDYVGMTNQITLAIDDSAVGDREIWSHRFTRPGRFRFEIDLPADAIAKNNLLLSFFGGQKRHPPGSLDQRKLSWVLAKVRLTH